MPISQSDQLFALVKSLTKAEKRNFRLYARRNQDTDEMLFLQMFDLIDKQSSPDDDYILQKMPAMKKMQFSNVKRHLYTQIVSSLRLIYAQKVDQIAIREMIDFADILYAKGLFLHSLKILIKAKKQAEVVGNYRLYLDILEKEKLIESRHITRSGPEKPKHLVAEVNQVNELNTAQIKLSNLRLLLHGNYIKHGHVKNQLEEDQLRWFFESNMEGLKLENLSTPERIFLLQSYVWYNFILLDFEECRHYATLWVDLFRLQPELIEKDPDLYMRAYHYLLTASFSLYDLDQYAIHLDELELFRKQNYVRLNYNSKIISFLYVHSARLNLVFLKGNYTEGLKLLQSTLRRLQLYKDRLDSHRVFVFYFKIAWLYLAVGQPGKSLDYINKILQLDLPQLREDIQAYAQLMFLMAHYDMKNFDIMDYLVQSVRKSFEKLKSVSILQDKSLSFFSRVCKAPLKDRKLIFEDFEAELEILRLDKYERRAFIYLDIQLWVKATIEGKTIEKVHSIPDYEAPKKLKVES